MPRTAIRKSRDIIQKRQKRSEIALAAAEAFAKKGFHAATMQDIAHECGYTAASLYTWFDSKEEIAEALFRTVKEELLASFDIPFPSGSSFAQRLELLLLTQFAQIEKRRSAFIVFQAAAMDAECNPEDHGAIHERLARWLRANATSADLGGNELHDAACVLRGIAREFVEDWMMNPRKPLAPRAHDVVRFFLQGVSSRERK